MLLGGAVVFRPLAGRAQQPVMPVVGFLDSSSEDVFRQFVAAFRAGLGELGFVEGRNVRIEYRWAEGQYDRLPGLAAELVRMPVTVLAATGITAALAAKAATKTIPLVFHTGGDPVQAGLVASLNKPGGNVTGVVSLNKVVVPKQLELLHELVPRAGVITFLVNPNNGVAKSDTNNVREAAKAKGIPPSGTPPRSSSRSTHSLTPDATRSPRWRHAMRFPQSARTLNSPRPAA